MSKLEISGFVFALTLCATFGASLLARRHAREHKDDALAGRNLNRWLVGLSAGTTANSGFIVTAAVGLGYTYGMQWMMLPLSWLLGDLVFWHFFPARINAFGHKSRASTVSQVLTAGMGGKQAAILAVLASIVIVICLAGYTSAQWLAGEKFLAGAFGLPEYAALAIFALLIIGYSSIGDFRGAVYTDTLQAIIRIGGTLIAVGAIIMFALGDPESFHHNISAAGPAFLSPFPGGTILSAAGFVIGFAAAAIGFGLGQPQILTRYLAGASPQETRAARVIYIGFVQSTWLLMTGFGLMLRGVMPTLADPEAGLSEFFQHNMTAVLTGLIAADIFATISSTSNGLLIAMAQALKGDLLPRILGERATSAIPLSIVTLAVGAITMLVSTIIQGTVVSLALASVSLLGAGLAAAVMARVMDWRHTPLSLTLSMLAGVATAIVWKYMGLGSVMNEAAPGIAVALIANWITCTAQGRSAEHAV